MKPLLPSATLLNDTPSAPASWLRPLWADALPEVGALMSGRAAPASAVALAGRPAFESFNLGDHVGDDLPAVMGRRALLADMVQAQPIWLGQVHGHRVVRLSLDTARPGEVLVDGQAHSGPIQADGSWTTEFDLACAVMVADCLPILLAGPSGRGVAALHAGWRGLCGIGPEMAGVGVVEVGLAQLCHGLGCEPHEVKAWLGPCIGPDAFEVGPEVQAAFDPGDRRCFKPHAQRHGKWLADLPALARARLGRLGVAQVTGGHWCTFSETSRFYSFRREPITGRQAALIWRRV